MANETAKVKARKKSVIKSMVVVQWRATLPTLQGEAYSGEHGCGDEQPRRSGRHLPKVCLIQSPRAEFRTLLALDQHHGHVHYDLPFITCRPFLFLMTIDFAILRILTR